jgi:hypothetical protein
MLLSALLNFWQFTLWATFFFSKGCEITRARGPSENTSEGAVEKVDDLGGTEFSVISMLANIAVRSGLFALTEACFSRP